VINSPQQKRSQDERNQNGAFRLDLKALSILKIICFLAESLKFIMIVYFINVAKKINNIALILLAILMATAPPAMAQAQGGDAWHLFGYNGEWSGHTAQQLDSQRWQVLTSPVGAHDAVGGGMIRQIAEAISKVNPLQQLRLVNNYYNSKPYEDDAKLFGVDDYWQFAEEFVRHGGDCEDFVIAKYRTLVAAGFPEESLRIVLLDDRVTLTEHAVLAARVGSAIFILDNQKVSLKLESQITTYRPLYAFNRKNVYYYKSDKPRQPLPDVVVTTRTR
jgi:predicted transglutaminase-like cysteine proteinase